jgi:GcrA cell cycle regulator
VAKTRWTIAQDQQLLQLERAGYSASLIGEQIKKTRNAVIGRSQRLRGYRRRSKAAPREQETTVQKPTNPIKPAAPALAPTLVIAREDGRKRPEDDGRRLISIFELTETTCRWPYGERSPYLFCGAPRHPHGRPPYCKQHARMHYR